jgi:hypothetical protein
MRRMDLSLYNNNFLTGRPTGTVLDAALEEGFTLPRREGGEGEKPSKDPDGEDLQTGPLNTLLRDDIPQLRI